jgi:hypothetical protein
VVPIVSYPLFKGTLMLGTFVVSSIPKINHQINKIQREIHHEDIDYHPDHQYRNFFERTHQDYKYVQDYNEGFLSDHEPKLNCFGSAFLSCIIVLANFRKYLPLSDRMPRLYSICRKGSQRPSMLEYGSEVVGQEFNLIPDDDE